MYFHYRLTLVKGWNMEEIANYATLLDLGKPDFIEIKGVTYCGSSGASSLTMQNVPYHADVCHFGEAICAARDGEYGLACEHAHSCCILLARRDRFWKDGRWHTWIDYKKFQVSLAFVLCLTQLVSVLVCLFSNSMPLFKGKQFLRLWVLFMPLPTASLLKALLLR